MGPEWLDRARTVESIAAVPGPGRPLPTRRTTGRRSGSRAISTTSRPFGPGQAMRTLSEIPGRRRCCCPTGCIARAQCKNPDGGPWPSGWSITRGPATSPRSTQPSGPSDNCASPRGASRTGSSRSWTRGPGRETGASLSLASTGHSLSARQSRFYGLAHSPTYPGVNRPPC